MQPHDDVGINLQEYLYREPVASVALKALPVHKMSQPGAVSRWKHLKTIYKLPGSICGVQLQAPPNQNIFLTKRTSDAKLRKSFERNSMLSIDLPKVSGQNCTNGFKAIKSSKLAQSRTLNEKDVTVKR